MADNFQLVCVNVKKKSLQAWPGINFIPEAFLLDAFLLDAIRRNW